MDNKNESENLFIWFWLGENPAQICFGLPIQFDKPSVMQIKIVYLLLSQIFWQGHVEVQNQATSRDGRHDS